MKAFTASLAVDRRLLPYDLRATAAHVRMLAARGILNATALESTLLLAPLYLIGVLLGGRLFARFSDKRFRQFTLVLLLAVSTFIMLA